MKKILFIFNQQNVSNVLTTQVVKLLFPSSNEYVFYPLEKAMKFFEPDNLQTSTYDEFVFIETYPKLSWVQNLLSTVGNEKKIEIYANYKNDDFISDYQYLSLHVTGTHFGNPKTTTIPGLFIHINDEKIGLQEVISTGRDNQSKLLIAEKFGEILPMYINERPLNAGLTSLDLRNDQVVQNFILNSDKRKLLVLTANQVNQNTLADYINGEKFSRTIDAEVISYYSINNLSAKTFDHLLKDFLQMKLVFVQGSFVEYVEFLSHEKVKLTYIVYDFTTFIETQYQTPFNDGVAGSTVDKLIQYLKFNFDLSTENFNDMNDFTTITGDLVEFNWNNTVSITTSMSTYLEIKDAETIVNP